MKTLLAFVFFLTVIPAVAANERGPEELVKQVTAEVLDALKSDKKLASGDRQRVLQLAEEKVMPHIDFEEATRLAVGRAWASASPEQKKQLTNEFRRMLVRIYSNAIQPYEGQTIQVAPVRMKPGDTEATVHNTFKRSGGGQAVGFDYSMRKTAQGWKIYDIVVEGVSLVLTYRSEFDSLVKQQGVDGLIKALASKNAPAAAAGGSAK